MPGEGVVSQHCCKMHSKERSCQETSFLDMERTEVLLVLRTHQLHCIKPYGSEKVKVADTSDGTVFCGYKIRKSSFVTSSEPQVE